MKINTFLLIFEFLIVLSFIFPTVSASEARWDGNSAYNIDNIWTQLGFKFVTNETPFCAGYSYCIFNQSGTIKAVNGTTQNIEFSGTTLSVLSSVDTAIGTSETGQGTIHVMPGLYGVSSEITITDGTSISCEEGKSFARGGDGDFDKPCKFIATSAMDSIFKFTGKSNLRNVVLDANNLANYVVNASFSSIVVKRTTFSNVDFQNAVVAGLRADNLDGLYVEFGSMTGNRYGYYTPVGVGGLQDFYKILFADNTESDVNATDVNELDLNRVTFANGYNLTDAQLVIGGSGRTRMDSSWMENSKYGNIRGFQTSTGKQNLNIEGASRIGQNSTDNLPQVLGTFNLVYFGGLNEFIPHGTSTYGIDMVANELIDIGSTSTKETNYSNITRFYRVNSSSRTINSSHNINGIYSYGVSATAPTSPTPVFGSEYSNSTSGEPFCKYGTQWQNATGNTVVC